MSLSEDIKSQIAESLQMEVEDLGVNPHYQGIPEWDSLAHISIMIDLENAFKIQVENEEIPNLTSLNIITEYIQKKLGHTVQAQEENKKEESVEHVYRGLNGIYFDSTSISFIDSLNNKLYYRGFNLDYLVKNYDYEAVSYLLLFKKLPESGELLRWKEKLIVNRGLKNQEIELIERIKDLHPLDVLRTVISSRVNLNHQYLENAAQWIAVVPTIIATHHRLRLGNRYIEPDSSLSHSANFLYMLKGMKPSDLEIELMNQDLIIHAEHGSNASAFAARIAIGAQTDFVSALTAAVAIFSGRVHGGALEEVLNMFKEISVPEKVRPYILYRIKNSLGVPGFGHRIYRSEDPRSPHLLEILKKLSKVSVIKINWEVIEEIKKEMLPYRNKGVEINVDFYAGLSYQLLGIPDDLALPVFFMARVSGLSAHIIEQSQNNILIRPLLKYSGPIYDSL